MNKQSTILSVISVVIVIILGSLYFYNKNQAPEISVDSFESCLNAGYPVSGTNPRTCTAKNGTIYKEAIAATVSYVNATSDVITVSSPLPGDVVGKQFSIQGQARGTWYFEASFPVLVLDNTGKVIYQSPAKALSDWMTTEFVPFEINVTIPSTYSGAATVVLKKDNPSGLSDREANVSFPVTIK
jgi:hypothetical protein